MVRTYAQRVDPKHLCDRVSIRRDHRRGGRHRLTAGTEDDANALSRALRHGLLLPGQPRIVRYTRSPCGRQQRQPCAEPCTLRLLAHSTCRLTVNALDTESDGRPSRRWVARKSNEGGHADSVAKYHAIVALCRELGVHTEPAQVGGRVWVVPLQSWYHASWDTEPDLTVLDVPNPNRMMTDFAACKWPKARQSEELFWGEQELTAWSGALLLSSKLSRVRVCRAWTRSTTPSQNSSTPSTTPP